MATTPADQETSALTALKTAAEHKRNSKERAELSCLSRAATSLLGVAVTRFDEPQSGIDYLRSRDVSAIVQRIADLNNNLYQSLIQNDGPPAAAVDNRITPVHIAWLIHEWDVAGRILAICTDVRVEKHFPPTKFWAEYHRAIECLVSWKPYNPELPKLRGYEKHWVPYLNLIATLTLNHELTDARKEIAESFVKRNRDKRLTDWEMIDGDGKRPVQWDFRETSILKFHELGPHNAS